MLIWVRWGKILRKRKDLDSFIYILYDKGIGAGIIINNQLYHGLNGYAGEIGHTLIIDNGKFTYFEDEYGIDKVIEQINKNFDSHKEYTRTRKFFSRR